MAELGALKKRLLAGQPAFGCFLEMFNPIVAEIVAGAGYDCVLIDCEHGPGSVLDAIGVMQAIQGADCTPLMRVAANDPVEIKRALDSGIHGVMIPAVDTPDQADAAVASCRYAPRGRRGMAVTVVRASGYGANWQDYVARVDDDLLRICQIESRGAVDNVAAIAAVEGVDLLFVGPFDLSASLGHLGAPDHEEVLEAIGRVEAAAKAAGKLLGAIPTPGRSVEALLEAGYDLILADVDNQLLRTAAADSVARLRRSAGGRG